jgi:hypothetical protein
LVAVLLVHGAIAQDKPPELTPAGKAIFQGMLADDGHPLYDRPGPSAPMTFPLAMCTFPGGMCGAVRRDGTVAVPPRYDWVGTFADHRAAVRLHGLYGFVDEDGHEVVTPQYRIVEDYHFGFAQVDVDGKSGLINRDGKMVIEPKYGFIRAIAPDRFRVSEVRRLGGQKGGEDFSGVQVRLAQLSVTVSSAPTERDQPTGVIDLSGQWIEPPRPWSPSFDKDDPSIRWVQKDELWGLARPDGSWLVEPKFQQVDALIDGRARVTLNGKTGFIDRTGAFAIAPVFDFAASFRQGLGRTAAAQSGTVGVIDKTGAWVFWTNYQEIRLATALSKNRSIEPFGWHFKKSGKSGLLDLKWGLLDLDGHVVLDADFDQAVQRCDGGSRLLAYKNEEWLYFKADGTPLQPPDGRLIDAICGSEPPYTMKIGGKFELVDANSNPVVPTRFDAVASIGSGVRNVEIDGKWGRIGPDGHWLLEPKFDYLSKHRDLFVASMDGKRGFMRADGSWLIEPKFDAARRRNDDTAFVTASGATGVLRLKDQSWAIPPRPGAMCDIHGEIVWQRDGTRAILSPAGDSWIDIGSERIGLNLDFGLLTFLKDGKWGLADTAGGIVNEPQFDAPVYFTPGLRGIAWAKRGGNWCAIDRQGHLVSDIPCADADPLGGGNWFTCKVEP